MTTTPAGVRPPDRDGPFGPIARVDFDHADGRPGGGHGYTLDVEGFAERDGHPDHENPELLLAGEELELWVWSLKVWRTCRFQWTGFRDPHLEVDVHHAGARGIKVGETEKRLDPRDLFRLTSTRAASHIPADAVAAIAILETGSMTTDRVKGLLGFSIARTRKALRYLREHGIAECERLHGLPQFHYTLTRKAHR